MIPLVTALFVSLLAGLLLVPAVRAAARRRGIVARPRADRWHREPTALLGGVAIWGAVLAGVAAAGPLPAGRLSVLLAATALGAFGLYDDLRDARPATKLVAQFAAAAVAIACGARVTWSGIELLDLAASFLWIVGITNAVNLLDNMDGLAAGVVLVAAQGFGWNAVASGHAESASLAWALSGALAAFLVFNAHPASIFMGDAGSLFLGFSLACLALGDRHSTSLLSFLAVPAMTLLVPILDTSLVTLTRALSGRSIAEGGRDHTSHRLVRLGLSEPQAVRLLWGLAALAGGAAVLTGWYSYPLGLALVPPITVAFGLLGVHLSRATPAEPAGGDEFASHPWVRIARRIPAGQVCLKVGLDFVLAGACWALAVGLRFGLGPPGAIASRVDETIAWVAASSLLAFLGQGIYAGVWRYVGAADLLRYGRAAVTAAALSAAVLALWQGTATVDPATHGIFAMTLFLALGGTRLSFRLLDEWLARRRPGRSVLLVGAGSRGEAAARLLLRRADLGLRAIGFADDAIERGRTIYGYRVLGPTSALEAIFEKHPFAEILVTAERLPLEKLRRLRRFCEEHGIGLRFFRLELSDRPGRAVRPRLVPSAEFGWAPAPRGSSAGLPSARVG